MRAFALKGLESANTRFVCFQLVICICNPMLLECQPRRPQHGSRLGRSGDSTGPFDDLPTHLERLESPGERSLIAALGTIEPCKTCLVHGAGPQSWAKPPERLWPERGGRARRRVHVVAVPMQCARQGQARQQPCRVTGKSRQLWEALLSGIDSGVKACLRRIEDGQSSLRDRPPSSTVI